jgi:hypothetical protein
MSTTLESLRVLAPEREWSMDPVTGLITVVHEHMVIHDPFVSECGRFRAVPADYGLSVEAGSLMWAHNALCPSPQD